jgi:hypothetical protein
MAAPPTEATIGRRVGVIAMLHKQGFPRPSGRVDRAEGRLR